MGEKRWQTSPSRLAGASPVYFFKLPGISAYPRHAAEGLLLWHGNRPAVAMLLLYLVAAGEEDPARAL